MGNDYVPMYGPNGWAEGLSDEAIATEIAARQAAVHGKPKKRNGAAGPRLDEFLAYLPEHRYIYRPTGDLWPAEALNGSVAWPQVRGKPLKPSNHLDQHAHVQQMTWAPGEPELTEGKLAVDGGWVEKPGARVYNLYRPPAPIEGDPKRATKWVRHIEKVYPDDANHIARWLAHRIQKPHEKPNHALVFGGAQGIGKDTLLAPVIEGVGPWNACEISRAQMLGRFNGWVKSVILRVSEARDLGELDRFAFYDHAKVYIAAPPDVLRVDEKNRREYPILNRCGVILTTNHKLDGIYLPPDDRRHYVAWSDLTREDFALDYWTDLWGWYGDGGIGHVVAYLRAVDLSGFDAKAPPPRTEAWEAIVQSNHAHEETDLDDVIEAMGEPPVLTVRDIVDKARALTMHDLANLLSGREHARRVPHKLDRAGYSVFPNPDAKDRRWKVDGYKMLIYGRKRLTIRELYEALRDYGVWT